MAAKKTGKKKPARSRRAIYIRVEDESVKAIRKTEKPKKKPKKKVLQVKPRIRPIFIRTDESEEVKSVPKSRKPKKAPKRKRIREKVEPQKPKPPEPPKPEKEKEPKKKRRRVPGRNSRKRKYRDPGPLDIYNIKTWPDNLYFELRERAWEVMRMGDPETRDLDMMNLARAFQVPLRELYRLFFSP